MNNKCVFCGNSEFIEKKVQYFYRNNDKFIIVNNVPCKVCGYCGEQYFGGKELEKIESLFFEVHNNKRKPNFYIDVPVEEFENISL